MLNGIVAVNPIGSIMFVPHYRPLARGQRTVAVVAGTVSQKHRPPRKCLLTHVVGAKHKTFIQRKPLFYTRLSCLGEAAEEDVSKEPNTTSAPAGKESQIEEDNSTNEYTSSREFLEISCEDLSVEELADLASTEIDVTLGTQIMEAIQRKRVAMASCHQSESEAAEVALSSLSARERANEKEMEAANAMAEAEAALAVEVAAAEALSTAEEALAAVLEKARARREQRVKELMDARLQATKQEEEENRRKKEEAEYEQVKVFSFDNEVDETTGQKTEEVDEARKMVQEMVASMDMGSGTFDEDEQEEMDKEALQILADIDVEFGGIIRQLEVAVEEAREIWEKSQESRDLKEKHAEEEADAAQELLRMADKAETKAQEAMEAAEEAMREEMEAEEGMQQARTALHKFQQAMIQQAKKKQADETEDEDEDEEDEEDETEVVEALEAAEGKEEAEQQTEENRELGLEAVTVTVTLDDKENEALETKIMEEEVEEVLSQKSETKETEEDDEAEEDAAATAAADAESKETVIAAATSVEAKEAAEKLVDVLKVNTSLKLVQVESENITNAAVKKEESTAAKTSAAAAMKEAEGKSTEKKAEDVAGQSQEKKSSKYLQAAFYGSTKKLPVKDILQQLMPLIAGACLLVAVVVVAHELQPDAAAHWFSWEKTMMGIQGKVDGVMGSVIQYYNSHPISEVIHLHPEAQSTLQMLYILAMSIVCVPLVSMLPGGSPVLGFLIGGLLLGPNCLGLIQDVHGVAHLAEFGVIFLLFNIGLELSYERLVSMSKYVFGLGSAQLLLSTLAVTTAAVFCGIPVNLAIVLGVGLSFSSTAVGMQVLQDRGETGSRFGRATFSVLLFQDLAVVLVFMLVPLLAPTADGIIHTREILQALAQAVAKTAVAIVAIIALGRVVLRPLYRSIAQVSNAEIFAATTLFVVLGTSLLTESLGLSAALGAFLAGLLLAETEFHLQVESDIAPYRGILLGLFFMTVGMTVDPRLLVVHFKPIMAMLAGLLSIKIAIVTCMGPLFGVSVMNSLRAGLFLGPGGEFAFVTFGEAVKEGFLAPDLRAQLTLVVALTMAVTPQLATLGHFLGGRLQRQDLKGLQVNEGEVDDLKGHIIIAGFGRVGQMVSQLLNERLIPFVALDVSSERVQAGRAMNLPVFFGDAGSAGVLHSVGAARAACAVITLDTPGANYRSVWALQKKFPHVKTFVRAHDVEHGMNLERAGATAVVPETLEPSLQLAAAALSQVGFSNEEISQAVESFRGRNLGDLQILSGASKSSLGYGFPSKPMQDDDDDGEIRTAKDGV